MTATWTRLATIDLPESRTVAAGDPCYGGFDRIVTIPAGTWHWDVQHGEVPDWGRRIQAARLTRRDHPADIDAAAWLSPYDEWLDAPSTGVTLHGIHGVDSGVFALTATAVDSEEILDAHNSLHTLHADAHALTVDSGFGDGAYPVYALADDHGEPTDIVAVFIPPARKPLAADEFTALLPGALRPDLGHDDLPARVGIRFTRISYDAARNGDDSEIVTEEYCTLRGLTLDGIDPDDEWRWRRQAPGHRVDALVDRLGGYDALADLGQITTDGATDIDQSRRGFIVEQRATPHTAWVDLP